MYKVGWKNMVCMVMWNICKSKEGYKNQNKWGEPFQVKSDKIADIEAFIVNVAESKR